MYDTWSLFLKTSENTDFEVHKLHWQKWFQIFTRWIFIYFSQILSRIGHSSQLRQSNFTWLENFKRKLLSGLFNAIKNKSFTKTTNMKLFYDEILNYLHLSCILHYRQLLYYSLFLHHQFLATGHYCVILFFCYKKSTSMQRNFIIEIIRETNRKMP